MPRFQVGDIAIVTNVGIAPQNRHYIGTEVMVVELFPFSIYSGTRASSIPYMVRCCDGSQIGAEECHLRKRDDDHRYDSEDEQPIWIPGQHSAASWDRCVWRPNVKVRT